MMQMDMQVCIKPVAICFCTGQIGPLSPSVQLKWKHCTEQNL